MNADSIKSASASNQTQHMLSLKWDPLKKGLGSLTKAKSETSETHIKKGSRMKTKRKRNRRIIKIFSDDEGMLPCGQRQVLSKHLFRSHVSITPTCVVSRLCFILSIKRKYKGQEKEMRCRAFCAVSDTPAAVANQEF